jgi:hypothetical protein
MNVVRHDYIATEANSAQLTVSSETNQSIMYISIREKVLALMRVERHKVQRRIVSLKYPVETSRPVRHEPQRTL